MREAFHFGKHKECHSLQIGQDLSQLIIFGVNTVYYFLVVYKSQQILL